MSDSLLDDPSLIEDLDAQAEADGEEGDGEEGGGTEEETSEGLGGGQDISAEQTRERISGVRRQPANETIRALRSDRQRVEQQLRDEAARREALERQLAEFRRPDPALLARQQAEEAERVAMMAPHEVAQYFANKAASQVQQQQQTFQRQQMDALDRIEFRGVVAANPVAKRFEDRVEKLVAEQAALGYSIKREQALKYAIGEAVLAKANGAAGKQKPAAAARVAASTTRRSGPGADVPTDRGARDSQAARAKRLENVSL